MLPPLRIRLAGVVRSHQCYIPLKHSASAVRSPPSRVKHPFSTFRKLSSVKLSRRIPRSSPVCFMVKSGPNTKPALLSYIMPLCFLFDGENKYEHENSCEHTVCSPCSPCGRVADSNRLESDWELHRKQSHTELDLSQ